MAINSDFIIVAAANNKEAMQTNKYPNVKNA